MHKTARSLALLLAALLALTGCASRQRDGSSPAEIALPEPSVEPINMILGERLPSRLSNVALYHPISDGATFSTVLAGIRAEAGETLLEAAVNALLKSGSSGGTYFPSESTRLLSLEYACGIATVNLSLEARNVQTEQEALSLLTGISNTLLGIEGVRGVNVLIGSQSESFGQLPMGVQTEIVPSVTAAYAQLQAEREHLLTDSAIPVTRRAALYFPTSGRRWLVPELREVVFTSDDFVGTLIDALKAGPRDETCAVASIPAGVDLLDTAPRAETLSTGEHVLTLNFASTLANYLAFSGLEVWELAGSVSLTFCSFMPEIDAVRILVGGDPITTCVVNGTVLRFADGLIRREDFANRVGSVATLYLAGQDGALQPVSRAVSMHSALSPRAMLSELFYYTVASGSPLFFPVPGGIFSEDILGIEVSGGIARVNLSANFYRNCQSLDAVAERNLVYAIVNTLCGLETVSAVRFYVEGISAETLAGNIYLKMPLIANPGIVVEPETTGEP